MDLTVFTWLINLFVAWCILAICVYKHKKKQAEKRKVEYIQFMKEHNIMVEGL